MKKTGLFLMGCLWAANGLFAAQITSVGQLDDACMFRFAVWSDDRGEINNPEVIKGTEWLLEGTEPVAFVLGGGDNSRGDTGWPEYMQEASTPDLWKYHYYNCIGDHENDAYGGGQSDWGAGGEMFDYLPGFWTRPNMRPNHYKQTGGGEMGDPIIWNETTVDGNGNDYYMTLEDVDGSGVNIHILSLHISDQPSDFPWKAFREQTRQFMEDILLEFEAKRTNRDILFLMGHDANWTDQHEIREYRRDMIYTIPDYINEASSHSFKRRVGGIPISREDGPLYLNSGRVGGGSSNYMECHVFDNPLRMTCQFMSLTNDNRQLYHYVDDDHASYLKNIETKVNTVVDWNNFDLNGVSVDPNGALFISQSGIPSSMTPGSTATVQVRMKNTGSDTWSSGAGHKLGSQNLQDNTTWGMARVVLPQDTAPNAEAVFSFDITAPATEGTYNFQWKMLDEVTPNNGWFGAVTPNISIEVGTTVNLANSSTHSADCGGLQAGKEIGFLHDGDILTPTAKGATDTIWVEYDFGADYVLSSTRLFGDDGGSWNSQSWTLEAWNGSSYVAVFTDSACFGTQWFENTMDVTTSRVKVTITGTTLGTEVFEVQIYGAFASEPNGYDAWVVVEGIIGEPLDDDDGDGLDNLSEYAVSEKPMITKSDTTFDYVYKQRTDDPSLSYEVQTCDDLVSGSWTTGGYTILGTNVTGGTYDDVTNSIPTSGPQSYIRLRVTNH
jgi:hypothetical protein